MDNDFFYDVLVKNVSNPNTRKNYEHRLNALINRMASEAPPDTPRAKLVLHIMTHPRRYMPSLQRSYNDAVSTIKNMVTLILSLFKYAGLKCRFEGTYKKWKQFHEGFSAREQQRYNTNEPTDKQVAKYTSFDDMHIRLKEWPHRDPHKDLQSSLQYCLISMYTAIRPKRADFGAIKVYTSKDPLRSDINYLVLDDSPRFVFNKYNKTHKPGDTAMIEPVSKDLAYTFNLSLSKHPRRYLYVGRDGKPFKTANSYSKFVINTFKKHFGKSTGVSMLRHIYISEKMDMNKLTVQEKDEIAKSMGHSRRQQEQYKFIEAKTT